MQPYTADHSISSVNDSLLSAKEVIPFIIDLLEPKKVIDVGCGLGAWLSVFKEYEIEEIMGIDGNYVDLDRLKIPRNSFIAHDLANPLKIAKSFDLVVSLEVAEHLSIENSENFVDGLVNLAPAVLFSAAVPYQPGDYHVNCQWPAYWANFFYQRGYVLFDCLRMKFWENKNVNWWYSQNMLIFIKKSSLSNYPKLTKLFAYSNLPPLSIIHPSLYLIQQNQNKSEFDNLTTVQICSIIKSKLIKILKKKFI